MSEDPILAALARIETSVAGLQISVVGLETSVARIEAEQVRLREQVNNKLDDILGKMTALRADTDTTRGYMLYTMQDSLTLSQRITKLEEEIRKPPL